MSHGFHVCILEKLNNVDNDVVMNNVMGVEINMA